MLVPKPEVEVPAALKAKRNEETFLLKNHPALVVKLRKMKKSKRTTDCEWEIYKVRPVALIARGLANNKSAARIAVMKELQKVEHDAHTQNSNT